MAALKGLSMVSAPKYLAQAAQVHQKQQLEQDESAPLKAITFIRIVGARSGFQGCFWPGSEGEGPGI